MLYADVPGAGEGDIKVTLENDILTIEAKVAYRKREICTDLSMQNTG